MRTKVKTHFNSVAENYDLYKKKNSYYYDNLKLLLKKIIPKNKSVLEIGCGTGDLLYSVKPKKGWGMDLSPKMIEIARRKYSRSKNLKFSISLPKEKFDYIFMSDVVEHLENPGEIFSKIVKIMDKKTRFVNTMANPLWEPMLLIWEKMGLKMPEGPHKRLFYKDLKVLCEKKGMKIVNHGYRLLIPIKVPLITEFANKYIEKYLKPFCFVEYFVAKKVAFKA